jgi:hypothetical protein
MEHVDQELETCRKLSKQWVGLWERARTYLVGITPEERTDVPVDTENGDPDDPEGDVPGDEPVDEEGAGEDEQEDADDV